MASTALVPIASEQAIVDRVIAFVRRFVFLRSEPMYLLLALWIIHTHLHELFEFTPYLFINSPDKQCGKTTLLEVLDVLVHNSTGINCSPTTAVVARTAKGNTQLFDEGDGWPDITGLRNIFNAGFQRNGSAPRCDQNGSGSFTPVPIPVFCPRAIAGIGQNVLSPTTRDRTFYIEMTRLTASESRERFRVRRVKPEADVLKEQIADWCRASLPVAIAICRVLVVVVPSP